MSKEKPICPECAQGKHTNCTSWALNKYDEIVDCNCHVNGHK